MPKAKVINLPFIVSPRFQPIVERIGNDDIGVFEITRRGYLTVAEKNFTSQALASDSSVSALRKIVIVIARDTGKSQDEVVSDITGGKAFEGYLEPYTDEILKTMEEVELYQQKRNIITVTCLMIYRVNSDWTVESTMELHPDVIAEISQLYEEEEAKSTKALEDRYSEISKEKAIEVASQGK